jgi:hypothetical protein
MLKYVCNPGALLLRQLIPLHFSYSRLHDRVYRLEEVAQGHPAGVVGLNGPLIREDIARHADCNQFSG